MKDNNKLQVILAEQGIGKSDVTKLVEAFGGPFEEAGVILATYQDIKVTSSSDTDGMQKAREARLLLKKARTTVENSRKELKADIVKQGRAIDSVAKFVKEEIEPAEQYLQMQEDFAKIEAEAIAAKLKNERTEKLMKYTDDISVYSLDAMTDDQFDSLLVSLKAQYAAEERRIADEAREAEETRKAEERRIAEQAKELARLKKEAEEKERADRIEEEKRQVEQAKKDAAAKAERDRIQQEAEERVAKEREAREKLEQEKRDREEAERKEKEAKERADREALLAPDKQKLIAFAQGLDTVRSERLPAVKTKQAQDVVNHLEKELSKLFNYVMDSVKEYK